MQQDECQKEFEKHVNSLTVTAGEYTLQKDNQGGGTYADYRVEQDYKLWRNAWHKSLEVLHKP